MNQIVLILAKDLRRGWPLLLLWAAILAYWIAPIGSDPLMAEQLQPIDGRQGLLVLFGGALAAALAIQQDSLLGVRELWMTRPIRIGSLMAAKAILVGAVIVLPPVLLQFAALVRYGLPPDWWAIQLAELALPWVSAVAIACLFAAWTRSLPAFFAGLAGFLLALNLGPGVVRWFGGLPNSASALLPTFGLFALGLLILQYATRRRTMGITIGAFFVPVAVFGLIAFDPYASLHHNLTPRLPDVQVSLAPGRDRETFRAERPGATADRVLDLWFTPRLAAAPPDGALEVSRVEGAIDWEDGTSAPFYAVGNWLVSDVPARSLGIEWAEGQKPQTGWQALGVQGDQSFDRLLGRRGALRGKAAGSVWKLAETKILPLQAGGEYQHGSHAIRILEVTRPPGDLRIRLRSRELVDLRLNYPRLQLALANRARGEAAALRFEDAGGRMIWGGLLTPFPFMLRADEGVWSPRPLDALGGAALDAEWLAGAELMLSYYDFAGTADVIVEAPNLLVDSVESGSPSLVMSLGAPWW